MVNFSYSISFDASLKVNNFMKLKKKKEIDVNRNILYSNVVVGGALMKSQRKKKAQSRNKT